MKDVKKTAKNFLTVAGAVAVVKKAPVLISGIVIGCLISNPDKAKKIAEELWDSFATEMLKNGPESELTIEFDDSYDFETSEE